MFLNNALASSPVGMAFRHYSDLFDQVVTRDRQSVLIVKATKHVANINCPIDAVEWMILNNGSTARAVRSVIHVD